MYYIEFDFDYYDFMNCTYGRIVGSFFSDFCILKSYCLLLINT